MCCSEQLVDSGNRLSIGMPVYNMHEYVGQAIESLLGQTFSDFEFLISDNCSTDGTYEICQSYAARDSRIRLHRHDANVGALPNFSSLVKRSSCPWFMWASGDDEWSSDWVERLMDHVVMDERAAFGRLAVIDGHERNLPHPAVGRSFHYVGGRIRRRLSYYLDPGILGRANTIHSIFPTRLLAENDIAQVLDGVLDHADTIYIHRLLEHVELVSVDGPILKKRQLASSESSRMVSGRSKSLGPLHHVLANMRSILLFPFVRQSSLLESLLLFTLFPIALLKYLPPLYRMRAFNKVMHSSR